MEQKSINKAKKEIWLSLQASTQDDELWDTDIEIDNWNRKVFKKALDSIFWQIERKL